MSLGTRIATAFAIVALSAAPAVAGPPWISVEYPANPLHQDTRGALLLVHTFHHGVAREFPLRGRAEGIVDGRRVQRDLVIEATYRPGVYAVRGELDGGSAWVLVFEMTDTDTGVLESMLVALNGDRALTAVDLPNAMSNEWRGPRAATQEQIDRFLEASIALAQARPTIGRVRAAVDDDGRLPMAAMIAGLVLVPVAVVGVRRARR
ncbi:MAG TPA: hypothetical protein VMN78_07610 [Longimicrobiales bacterium]|nr:hypothetical protein [Longimicrobiales bacterium]